mmetsp:Transcript_76377/g.210914  ORF Transcript_76377/g.210914 Transcript_76377/m.210914 type:complete len:216 (+) Transcript_76377:890-1537(+)
MQEMFPKTTWWLRGTTCQWQKRRAEQGCTRLSVASNVGSPAPLPTGTTIARASAMARARPHQGAWPLPPVLAPLPPHRRRTRGVRARFSHLLSGHQQQSYHRGCLLPPSQRRPRQPLCRPLPRCRLRPRRPLQQRLWPRQQRPRRQLRRRRRRREREGRSSSSRPRAAGRRGWPPFPRRGPSLPIGVQASLRASLSLRVPAAHRRPPRPQSSGRR